MSILDSVLGGLLGGQQAPSPVQGILGSILGGGGGGVGGLGGLMQRFEQAGLGNVAQSWVGNGPNQPIQPQQLEQVFGHDQINQWAQQSGMSSGGLLSQLAQFLPHAVDHLTPNGQMPSGGMFGGAGTDVGGGEQMASGNPFGGAGRTI